MDLELIVWILVFFGGYGLVLGWLLSVAMRKPPPGGGETHR
jgi:hypothetical protein